VSLHNELEEFLSSALFAFLTPEEETALLFWFGGDQLHRYSDPYNYNLLINFFTGRRITLLIYRNHPTYNFSFVEMESGDCLNISKVRLVKGSEQILAGLSLNTHLEFDIIGVSADNEYMVEPPNAVLEARMLLEGYQLI